MEQQIHITLSFELATGKANLNEILYRLEQLKNPLMLRILKEILVSFEHEVIEAVIDTNYRRLIEGRSIDFSLGGIHNIVVGSDVDRFDEPVDLEHLSAIMADATGYKRPKGKKAELRDDCRGIASQVLVVEILRRAMNCRPSPKRH